MKTVLLIFSIVLMPFFCTGQNIEKFSLDSGGASISQGSIKVLYTLGEVNVQEFSAGNIHISEGFINPAVVADSEQYFITKWVVLSGETITIPTLGFGYDYDVDWSYDAADGFNSESSNVTGDVTSPVLGAGEYTVAISGDFPRIFFNNSGDKDKITEIVEWGSNPWTSMDRAFAGCSNLNITNPDAGVPNLSFVTDMTRMFNKATSFNGAIGDWDVSNVTSMSYMFSLATAFNQDLSSWNTANVTNMRDMFNQALAFNGSVDWDVSNVQDMQAMFLRAYAFNQDISNWDTSSVTSMYRMFRDASSFNQNLGSWDIGNVTTMESMFLNAGLSTSNYDDTLIGWATDSSGIPSDGIDDIPINVVFDGGDSTYCSGETARNLLITAGPAPAGYGWAITDSGTFCVTQSSPFITKWVVLSGETITIPTLGFGYDYDVDWSYDAADGFNAESSNVTGDVTSPVLGAGEYTVAISGDFPRIFFNNSGDKDKITEIVEWGSNPWTSMDRAFAGCSNLNITNPDAGVPNLSFVTDMTRMFNKATSFNGAIGDWDVSNVTSMSYMFSLATAFNQDLSSWNTANVTNMRDMFNQALAFNGSVDWDVSNVQDMQAMFLRAYAFNQDISNWDTSSVTSMYRMFRDASSFNQNLGSWDIGNVTTMESMFLNAGLSTSNYDDTLIGWATDSSGIPSDGIDDIPINVVFDGGDSTYCSGETARNLLITAGPAPAGYGWAITDSGTFCVTQSSPFITKWVVLSGETITIPTLGFGYDYDVDWSYDAADGFNAESSNVTGDVTSPVLGAGEYTVAISGDFPRIFFNNSGDKDKITEIVEWGSNPWTSMDRAFAGCSNLNITNPDAGVPNLSFVTDMTRMFNKATSFNGAIGDWDVSNVTSMSYMFSLATAFNQDLSSWNTANVTNMRDMFNQALAFNGSVDWDVSNVQDMQAMFLRAYAFNQDISNWDTSSVTSMYRMFRDASSFNQNLGSWDIGNVTTMESMILNAGLSTSNYDDTLIGWATDRSGIPGDGIDDIPINVVFDGGYSTYCSGETARNLLITAGPAPAGYGWAITDSGTFCVTQSSPFITKWVVLSGETITIPTLGFGYDYDVDWSYDAADGFNAESSNVTGDVTSPVLGAGEYTVAISGDFPRIFFNNSGDKDKITEIVEWGPNPWTSMDRSFAGCSNLNITNPDAGVPNLSLVTDMTRMFNGATSFNGAIGDWDVSNVTNMSYLFASATAFNQNLDNWDVSNVTNMNGMFDEAEAFNGSVDWDVSNVQNMAGMFLFAENFNQDISNWDTSSVTNMYRMLPGTFSFDQNLEAWDISNVTNMIQMFTYSQLSTSNYDNTLVGWSTDSSGTPGDGIDDVPTNISFDGGNSVYCNGEFARGLLTGADYGWTITDGGLDCPSFNAPGRSSENVDRLWISVANDASELSSTALISFSDNTADDFIDSEDKLRLPTPVSIYSELENGEQLEINALDGFETTDDFFLSFSSEAIEIENYVISIKDLKGLNIEKATIYLIDTFTNTVTNLTENDYYFQSGEAVYSRRFNVVFKNSNLKTNDTDLLAISLFPNPTTNQITVLSPRTDIIDARVYDIRGRIVSKVNFTNHISYQIDLSDMEPAVYIVDITTEKGTITKRVIKKD